MNMNPTNNMMFGPPPPQMPHNGATHPLQTTQSGNHIVSSGSTVNSMPTNLHPNHVHPQQQAGGPTQQSQYCNYGARQLPHHVNGMNVSRANAVPTGPANSCFSNPPGVHSVPLPSQSNLVHQISAPPPPYHFQHAPNNATQGSAYLSPPNGCNLQGVPIQIPFSTAGDNHI